MHKRAAGGVLERLFQRHAGITDDGEVGKIAVHWGNKEQTIDGLTTLT